MEQISKKIFVVGCSRSGTTLLQSILTNIENSFSMPETHFFEILPDNHFIAPRSLPPFGKFKYPQFLTEQTFKRIIEFMTLHSNLPEENNLIKSLKKELQSGTLTPGKFFEGLTGVYSTGESRILIEKTPSHIFHVPFIRKIFPEAIIVNIVRDPRDVFVSYQKLIKSFGKARRSVTEFTHLWNKAVEYGVNLKLETVRYEDLIERPIELVNEILNKHRLKIKSVGKNSYEAIVNPKETWKGNIKKKIIQNNTKKYLTALTGREISHIEKKCEQGMKYLGYEKVPEMGKQVAFDIGDFLSWSTVVVKIRMNILKARLKSW